MRRILVDFARNKRYQKRGGGAEKVTFDEQLIFSPDRTKDLVALEDALQELAVSHPRVSHASAPCKIKVLV